MKNGGRCCLFLPTWKPMSGKCVLRRAGKAIPSISAMLSKITWFTSSIAWCANTVRVFFWYSKPIRRIRQSKCFLVASSSFTRSCVSNRALSRGRTACPNHRHRMNLKQEHGSLSRSIGQSASAPLILSTGRSRPCASTRRGSLWQVLWPSRGNSIQPAWAFQKAPF